MAGTTTMSMDMNHTMDMNSTMDHGDMTHHMTHMMQMWFTMSSEVTILFEQWATTNTWELVGSCIAVFVVAMLYEGLKVFREMALSRSIRRMRQTVTPSTSISGSSKDAIMFSPGESGSLSMRMMCTADHALQSLLHVLQVTVSYLLMLVAMTYNGWLFIAIVTGAGAGHFAFSWKRVSVVDINEHCH